MATTLMTPEQYLGTSFEGLDCEYIDGEIVERTGGELQHSQTQVRLVEIVFEVRQRMPAYAFISLRLKLSATRYRIPDIAIFADHKPEENVPSVPPLIVVEIASRDDSYTKIVEKLQDYHVWGVPHVWLVDPRQRKLSIYRTDGLTAVGDLKVPELNLTASPVDLFG